MYLVKDNNQVISATAEQSTRIVGIAYSPHQAAAFAQELNDLLRENLKLEQEVYNLKHGSMSHDCNMSMGFHGGID